MHLQNSCQGSRWHQSLGTADLEGCVMQRMQAVREKTQSCNVPHSDDIGSPLDGGPPESASNLPCEFITPSALPSVFIMNSVSNKLASMNLR